MKATQLLLVPAEWAAFKEGEGLHHLPHLHEYLYNLYFNEMPYGTAKARTGDPYEWLSERTAYDCDALDVLIDSLAHAR